MMVCSGLARELGLTRYMIKIGFWSGSVWKFGEMNAGTNFMLLNLELS